MVDRKLSGILDELTKAPIKNREAFIEHRAEQTVAAFNNLGKLLRETYGEEVATDLFKRLLLSAKTNDVEKFKRGLKGVKGEGDV